jgi:hypothetical protein
MRRLPTGLLLAAVAALAVAATVDALRTGSESSPRSPAQPTVPPEQAAAVAALRAAGVAGTITYSDEDCRLHAFRLPTLRPARASGIQICEPHVPTGGIGTFGGDVVWAGLGFGFVEVVLSKEELSRVLGRSGYEIAGGYRARQAVPLAGGRYAVLAEPPRAPWSHVLVFLAGKRARHAVVASPGEAESLRPSPSGGYVAVFEAGEPSIRLFSSDGEELPLPAVTNPHAIAWSPDERWTALATRASVYVFPTDDPDHVIRIPVSARDLHWEADETLGAAAALREGGASGVLTYAGEDCRLEALTLPDLRPHPAPPGRACTLARLETLRFGRPVGDPQRVLVARCRSGRVELAEVGGPVVARAPGCAPAWRPDGTLTAVRDGEVASLFPARVLLSRGDLVRELGPRGWPGTDFSVEEIAWLDGATLAAVVRTPRDQAVLALFRSGRLVARPSLATTSIEALRVSPRRSFVTARSSRGALVVDREGRRIRLPVGVTAVAWSPDEQWIAATRSEEIAFFPFEEPSSRGISLPIAARDLVWR